MNHKTVEKMENVTKNVLEKDFRLRGSKKNHHPPGWTGNIFLGLALRRTIKMSTLYQKNIKSHF